MLRLLYANFIYQTFTEHAINFPRNHGPDFGNLVKIAVSEYLPHENVWSVINQPLQTMLRNIIKYCSDYI